MGISNNSAFSRLSEYFRKAYNLYFFAFYYIFQYVSGRHRRELIGVTYKYQSCTRFYGFQKIIEQLHIYHRYLVDYYNVSFYRLGFVFIKLLTPVVIIGIRNAQHSVYCFSLYSRCFRHSFSRSSRRGRKNDFHSAAFKYLDNRMYYSCFTCAGASRNYKDSFPHSLYYGGSLLFSKAYSA